MNVIRKYKNIRKQLKKRNVWIICTSVFLLFILYFIAQNNWIEVEHIEVKINNLPRAMEGIKIAQISDAHIPQNASSIRNLLKKVNEEKPDIIVMTGDIIDKDGNINDVNLNELCRGLGSITNTYAVTGNHEVWNNNLEKWKEILQANNIKVVENEIEIYEKNNNKIAIMGLKDNCSYSYKYFNNI